MIPECHYCKSTQPDMFKPKLFFGFFDADMKITVCWDCKETHYEKKKETEHRWKYSEIPIPLNSKK